MKFSTLSTLLLFFLIGSTPLFAQDASDASEDKPPIVSAGISVGAVASNVNSNKLAFPVTQLDFNKFTEHTSVNEYLSIHFIFHLGKSYGVESGIIYDKKTYHYSGRTDVTVGGVMFDNREVDANYSYEYFTVPLLFKKTLGQNKLKASIFAGPYIGFLQSANFTIQDHTFIEKHGGGFEKITNEQGLTIDHLSRKTNVGILLKVGAEMQASPIIKPFINAFWSRGFSRIDDFSVSFPDEQSSDGQHASYGAAVGVYFRMK